MQRPCECVLRVITQDRSYNHQQCLQLYQECSPIDQELLQALALLHVPCPQPEVIAYALSVPRSRLSTLSAAVLEARLDTLKRGELIEEHEDGSIAVPGGLIQELISKLVWGQKIDAYYQAARARFPYFARVSSLSFDASLKAEVAALGPEALMLALRVALYCEGRGFEAAERVAEVYEELFPADCAKRHPYLKAFDSPFQDIWFSHFTPDLTAQICIAILFQKIGRLQDPARPLETLEGLYRSLTAKNLDEQEELRDEIYRFLTIFYRLRGRPSAEWLSERTVTASRQGWSLAARAFQQLIEGAYETSMATFHRAWRYIREESAQQQRFMGSPLGPLFVLNALNQRQHNINNNQVLTLASKLLIPLHSNLRTPWRTDFIYPLVTQVIGPYVDQRGPLTPIEANLSDRENISILWLFEALYGVWHYGEDYGVMLKPLRRLYLRAKQGGYMWLAAEAGSLIAHLDASDLETAQEAERLHERLGTQSLVNLHPVKLGWRKLLERLRDVGNTRQQLDTRLGHSQSRRVLWVTQGEPKVGDFKFMPYIQESIPTANRGRRPQQAGSQWGRSYRATLKDIYRYHQEHADLLTPQDHRVCAQMIISGQRARAEWEHYSERDFKFDPTPALIALVGHPLLFLELRDPKDASKVVRKAITLQQDKPTLKVTYPDESHLSMALTPKLSELPEVKEEERVWIMQTPEPDTYRLIECGAIHRQIAEMLDQDIRIPRTEQALLNTVIDQLSNFVSVQADVGEVDGIIEHATADSTLILIFTETDEGALKVQIRVQPFLESENLMRPGEGGSVLSMLLAGRRLRVERNLEEETRRRQALLEACPIFSQLRADGGDWLVDQQERYLDLLLQVRSSGEEVRLQMPKGKEVRVDRLEVGRDRMSLKVTKESSAWFKLDGTLVIDEQLSLSVRDLLLKERVGRFITMGNNEFIAISPDLVQTLNEIKESAEISDKGVRFRGTSAALISESLSNFSRGQVEVDRHWSSIIKKLGSVNGLMPPDELNAELRDYQLEGFRWLSGHAMLEGSTGVCLADDMGLGKTLQALTLMLSRSKRGPSLVVAPTSVVQNWINEAERFTPTLRVRRFGGTREQRERMVRAAGPDELLVCTYGLLKIDVELLAEQNWNILLLDEAQNIKNHTTQASKAAVRLRSRFRFVATGTPIENNLMELWSLFQFLNPHLLKGIKDFRDRFLNPIEKGDDGEARQRLSQLISPFILRRTKESVLDDLPPLTETTHSVELSDEERQLYEAVKREQLAEIERQFAQGDTQAHMELFALLTKLRQLSCHPRLVFPNIDVPSSKLNYFEELARQIISGGHKVLVFSQFVRHLDLVKERLEQMRVPYQYLTGETSPKERQRRVDAFQAGDGDVFLISLKAGGVGLNLTAADYVIHMDPWWNPAVEDQASDRAHRIGQERPVTVYRLVGKDTIEEQIVSLHESKRNLADAILDGSDRGLNTSDLMALLRAQMAQDGVSFAQEAQG